MKVDLLNPAINVDPYCWLISLDGKLVGVERGVGWCAGVEGGVIPINSEERCVPLGPVLEVPLGEFLDFLRRAALSNPEYAQWILEFPKENLLKHIFHTSFSGYWPEKAVAWLSHEPALWASFGPELRSFMGNKVMAQGARQQAQRMIRSVESKLNARIANKLPAGEQ